MIVSENAFLVVTRPRPLQNLIPLTLFVTLRPCTLFGHKIRAIKLQKRAKFALLGNCFFDLFTEVEIWYQKNCKFVLGRFLKR